MSRAYPKIAMTAEGLAAEAYAILGISEIEVIATPRITPILESSGAMKLAWDYIEASGTKQATELLFARKKLDAAHARAIPIEAFCVAAKVPSPLVLEIIGDVLKQQASLFRNVRALEKLGSNNQEEPEQNKTQQTALLPAIEDDVKQISDSFNGKFLTTLPATCEEDEDDENDEDDEDV